MIITLDEMKNYLRVDHDDDDILLESLIASSQQLCMDVARIWRCCGCGVGRQLQLPFNP